MAFLSVSALSKSLGNDSACIDMLELAILEFLSRADAVGLKNHVEQLKLVHKVPSKAPLSSDGLARFARQLHLATTVDAADTFFRRFATEIKSLPSRTWRHQRGGEQLSSLEATLDNSPAAHSHTRRSAEYAILRYYWECRQAFTHRLSLDDAARLHAQLCGKHGDAIRNIYSRLPSHPMRIAHGDRILLGRALLTFADMINDDYGLTPLEVADIISRQPLFRTSRGFSDDYAARKFKRLAKSQFKARPDDAEAVAACALSLLRATPPKV